MKKSCHVLSLLVALALLFSAVAPCLAEKNGSLEDLSISLDPPGLTTGRRITTKYFCGVGKTLQLYPLSGLSGYDTVAGSTWKSSDPKVAKVSKRGLVTARRVGKVTITLTAPGFEKATMILTCARQAKPSFKKSYWTSTPSPEKVYKALMRMKKQYPNGTRWNDYDLYVPIKPINSTEGEIIAGFACNGFAYMMFDAAFGSRPVQTIWFPDTYMPGDVLQLEPYHKVIVLKADKKKVTVAEGNYGGKVKWGRTIPLAKLKSICTFSLSRYPVRVVPIPPPVVK